MSENPIAQLVQLAPASADAPDPADCGNVERELNTKLPSDYKQLVQLYGGAPIDDFIWLLVPGHENEHLDLLTQMTHQLDALRELDRSRTEELPHPLYPEAGGLLPWALTDNGDVCYWVAAGDPETWTVTVNAARSPEWFEFAGTAAEFLLAVLTGELKVPIFPDDFPSPELAASK